MVSPSEYHVIISIMIDDYLYERKVVDMKSLAPQAPVDISGA